MEYETRYHLCSAFDGCREAAAPGRFTFGRRLHAAPLSNPAGQRGRPDPGPDRPQPGLYGRLRPQRHPRLPRRGPRLPPTEVLPAPKRQTAPGLGLRRTAADPVAPEPRTWGQDRSTWTLGRIARVCFERGWTPRVLGIESIRLAVQRLGVSWKRAKHWITSPDPAYAQKKSPRPPDPSGRHPPRVGPGFPGRVLVESVGPAEPARPDGGRPPASCRSWRPARTTRTPRRWPAMGRRAATRAAYCRVSWTSVRSAWSRSTIRSGCARNWRGKARRRCWVSSCKVGGIFVHKDRSGPMHAKLTPVDQESRHVLHPAPPGTRSPS